MIEIEISIEPMIIVGRLLLAALLGGVIGWEREQRNKQAGVKTHLLVSVGSALIMIISLYGFNEAINHPNARFDPSRLAHGVISGIGFLGAGAILRHSNKVVSGLTTAAMLWVVAAIGIGIGAGFYFPSIVTTVIAYIGVVLMRGLESRFIFSKRHVNLRILIKDEIGKLGEIGTILGEEKVNISQVSLIEESDDDSPYITIQMGVQFLTEKNIIHVVERLYNIKGIKEIEYD